MFFPRDAALATVNDPIRENPRRLGKALVGELADPVVLVVVLSRRFAPPVLQDGWESRCDVRLIPEKCSRPESLAIDGAAHRRVERIVTDGWQTWLLNSPA